MTDRLLRASAGTGKTHALVNHYVSLVCDEGLLPEQVVLITFTRKAAAELRSRAHEELVSRGASSIILAALARAPITTFHGLCAEILRELGSKSGAATPQLVEGEGEDRRLFFTAAEEAWLNGDVQTGEALSRVARWLVPDDTFLSAMWQALSRSREDGHSPAPGLLGRYDVQARKQAVHQRLVEIRANLCAPDERVNTPKAKDVIKQLSAKPVPALDAPMRVWLTGWQEVFGPPLSRHTAVRKIYSKEDQEYVNSQPRACLADEYCQALVPDLERLLLSAWRGYTAAKQREGVLDYADLIEHTLARLTRDTQAHLYMRQRIRAVLVDEAQDTNALQRKLVLVLVGRDGPQAADMSGAPAAAQLTVVGDAKQAIYTFRGADAHNFALFAQDIAAQRGIDETLSVSYRSTRSLIASINHLGTHLLGEAYEPLMPREPQPPMPQPYADLEQVGPAIHWHALGQVAGVKASRQQEAEGAANVVAALHEQGVAYGDIGLLLAAPKNLAQLYVRAFGARGIPVALAGTGSLWQRPEVADIVALLAWMADGSRRLDAAIALRSPLIGLSDGGLYALCSQRELQPQQLEALRLGQVPQLALALSETDQLALHWAAGRLAMLQRVCSTKSPPMAIHEAIDAFDVRALALAHDDGPQRLANIERLLALAARAHEQGCSTIGDFLLLQRWRIKQGIDEPQGAVPTSQRKAVTLSSVHISKGLQYPVVVLCALDQQGRPDGGQMLYTRQEGMTFRPKEGAMMYESTRYLRAKQARKVAEQQERARLLYVAITRAKYRVVLVGRQPEDCEKKGFGAFLGPWAESAVKAGVLARSQVDTTQQACLPAAAMAVKQQDSTCLSKAVAAYKDRTKNGQPPTSTNYQDCLYITATQLAKMLVSTHDSTAESSLPIAPSATGLSATTKAKVYLPPLESSALYRLSPAMKGNMVHRILARMASLPAHATQAQREAWLDQQICFESFKPTDPAMTNIRAELNYFLGTDLGQKLANTKALQRRPELSFVHQIQQKEAHIQVRGTVDLLAIIEGNFVLVDFKSTLSKHSAETYLSQLEVYAWALTGSGIIPPEAVIYSHLVYLSEASHTTTQTHTNQQRQATQEKIVTLPWSLGTMA